MRRRSLGALLVLGAVAGACSPATAPSPTAGGACVEGLPPRTSPTDYPVAVLYAAGDDLPPVVGEVDWLGGDEPVATVAPRAVHLQRFTVLQVQGLTDVSLRMSDGVSIAAWQVTAISDVSFRSGDLDGGTEWSSGQELTDVVCVPITDGAWAIRADITFADDDGSGTFFWRLNVSESPNG
jgi:hypothetical protein